MNRRMKLDLQLFAAGGNNGQPVRSFQKEYKEMLETVFENQAYFRDFFGGGIEALDGVQNNETAFYIKTSDIPVVVGNYNKGANVGMGTGTSKSNRFGDRTEVVYTDTPVPYTWDWAYHEGIDIHTVNNDFEVAVADRLDLQAQAKVDQLNAKHGTFISESAAKEVELSGYTADEVVKIFNDLSAYFTNIEAKGTKVAKVNSELYNAIVDHPLTTTGKSSIVNIDNNDVPKFKGFEIDEIPEKHLGEDEVAFAYVVNVGKAFIGINTMRSIGSEDFDGTALQGSGKAGEFILEDNKKAVAKVKLVPGA